MNSPRRISQPASVNRSYHCSALGSSRSRSSCGDTTLDRASSPFSGDELNRHGAPESLDKAGALHVRRAIEVFGESGARSVVATLHDGKIRVDRPDQLGKRITGVDLHIAQSVGSNMSTIWSLEVLRSGILA